MSTTPAILGPARLGNFRLGYVPAALAAVRKTRVTIQLAGVLANARVRVGSLTVHDILNDAPNTCSLTVDTTAPSVGQDLRVLVNSDTPVLLFNGQLQTVDLSYEGKPTQPVWACTAIDDTSRANYRRPFGTFTNVSATTVAQSLITTFAPGFTATHVQASLPNISVNFDGTEGFSGCLTQIAKLIGGYWYVEDLDLHLFQTEATNAPDPIDGTPGRVLDHPPIRVSTDMSQLRTRVYGKGGGVTALVEIPPGSTTIPVEDQAWYNASGGTVISSTQRLTYTGVSADAGQGTVTGGIPQSPGTLTAAAASGAAGALGAGTYNYKVTCVNAASGESEPGSAASGTISTISAPGAASAAASSGVVGALTAGTYGYKITFVTATGGTVAGTNANGTLTAITPPTPSLTSSAAGPIPAGTYNYKVTCLTSAGETIPGSNGQVITSIASTHTMNIPTSGDTRTLKRNVYRTVSGGSTYRLVGQLADNSTTAFVDSTLDAALGTLQPPTSSGVADAGQMALTSIPTSGDARVSSRRLYRTAVGGAAYGLIGTLSNNSTTTFTDNVADGNRGAAPPASTTADNGQMALTAIATGPAGTTSRKIYRTIVGGAAYKALTTVHDNTATTFTDNVPDTSLGAAAPAVSTWHTAAGSTTLPVADTAKFSEGSGWARASNQIVRFTGRSTTSGAGTLTGIPASGMGALAADVVAGTEIVGVPFLKGVAGVVVTIKQGDPVNIFVQRDHTAAQATYGIIEHLLSDERRAEPSLIALCDADLTLFSAPLVTVTYACRDTKTKSGKTIVINLSTPPINETLTIQDVTITEIDLAPGLSPKYTVTASNVRFSLEALLRGLRP